MYRIHFAGQDVMFHADVESFLHVIGPSFRTWPLLEALAKGDNKVREAYETAKQEEAERIIGYLASYYPAFKANLVDWEIGSPVTIERYALKNKGSVAGPKQMVGQDLMHRQHAETRWKNLFCCGESTTMGTGTPAVVISGLSAADVILRREGLPEYRYFSDKGFVQYLKSPAPAYAQGGLSAGYGHSRYLQKALQWES